MKVIMKKSILALSVVLASGSAFAAYEDKGEGYITASQLTTLYDGSYVDIESEFIGLGGGWQSSKPNALYLQLGGQLSMNQDLEGDDSENIISLETKIGYSFDGEAVTFIPYFGSSLGIDMYEMNGYSDSEFVTRIFVGAELRVIQTVGLYFNTGVLTAFETNFDFSEVGLKVSF